MNAAAIEIAGTMLKTQAAERGAISLPGTPTQRLGSYLTYSQKVCLIVQTPLA